jgi:hypothetical protein
VAYKYSFPPFGCGGNFGKEKKRNLILHLTINAALVSEKLKI